MNVTDPTCSICGNPARILIADPSAGLDTLCLECWQARGVEAPPRVLDPSKYEDDDGRKSLKLVALAVVDAMLDNDPERVLQILPGPYALDLVHVIEPLAKVAVAAIRSRVGWKPEDGRDMVDVFRQVVLHGAGL